MGQPVRLKENLLIDLIKSSTKMALGGSRLCCSSRGNLFPLDLVEDELARDLGPTEGPHLASTSSAPSCNPTLGPALVSAPIPASVPTPTPTSAVTNDLFKQFIKAYLKSNQRPREPPAERERLFKAKVSKIYYGKLYIDCYHFCQQCKDYFQTARAIGANQTLFEAFFFHKNISVC